MDMKKPFKIILVFCSVLLLLLIAASIFVRSYLTQQRMRSIVTDLAEKSINRQVVIGEIDLSLFRGIVVKELQIKEKNSEATFFKTRDFVLKYQFLPLLTKKLVIDQLSIDAPEIYLRKSPDGSYNFSDIAKSGNAEEQKVQEESAGLPVNLSIREVAIKNARVHYTDMAGKMTEANLMLNLESGITGTSGKSLTAEGACELNLQDAHIKAGKKLFQDIKMDVRYKVSLELEAKKITLHTLDVAIMGIPIKIRGTVSYAGAGETAYALNMTMQDFNLSQLEKGPAAAFLPEGMNHLTGDLSVFMTLNKAQDKINPPEYSGSLKLSRAGMSYKGLSPVLDGSLKVTPKVITLEGMKLIAGKNSADLSGTLKNYIDYPDLNIAIKSKSIDLDDLIVSTAVPSPTKQKEPLGKTVGASEPGPMNLKLKCDAALDIEKTRFRGISITDFKSRCELNDNVIRIPYLSGNTMSGAFSLKAAIDLNQKGTRYDVSSDLKGVKIEEIINAFAPQAARGKLFGTLSGTAELSGGGMLPVNVKRNLKGKGAFVVKDGVLKNTPVSAGLLTILGLQDMKEIPIQKAEGNFAISAGVVNLVSLISSKDLILDETGTIGMDENLDLGIIVKASDRLAPKLVSQSSITGFLSSEKGWTSIPLRVGGTISKPSYGIDVKAVGKKVTESIQKKIGQELLKVLPKNKEQRPAGTEQNKNSGAGDLIRGLFGN